MIDTQARQRRLFSTDGLWLTDGGIETTFIFHEGYELPEFAVFPLLGSAQGRDRLEAYYGKYVDIAKSGRTGFVLETPTWRASNGWGRKLGYSAQDIQRFNVMAVEAMELIRAQHATPTTPMLISGCVGPQDDAYDPGSLLSVHEAQAYHADQIRTLAGAGADLVTAITMTHPQEAVGIANAAADAGLPSVIAFTVETDGRLPVGVALADAIRAVDEQAAEAPAYYMINCAHPDHFRLPRGESWLSRIGGVRANASRMSHAELDACETLDDGDPAEFGRLYRELRDNLVNLRVLGGCCGTDHRHVASAAAACLA